MRFVLVWLLTVGTGIWAIYLIGWLVGLLWAPAQLPIYFVLAGLWALIGLLYAWTKLRQPSPLQTPVHVAKSAVAFLLSAAAAYSLSFVADMLFGWFLGTLPNSVWAPIGSWTVISATSLWLASMLSKGRLAIVMPWFAMGAYVFIGTIAGPYPRRYLVAATLFAFAAWLLGRLSPIARPSEPNQQPLAEADFWHPSQLAPSGHSEAIKPVPPIAPAELSAEPNQPQAQHSHSGEHVASVAPSPNGAIVEVDLSTISVPVVPAAHLKASQITRIRAIAAVLLEVYPKSDKDWIEGFAMDGMPEREIATWEVMALAYSSYTAQHELPFQ